MVGDVNVSLKDTEGDQREEDITAVMMAAGLEYMSNHFLPQWIP